jgi:AcrR family transcriptional regulator
MGRVGTDNPRGRPRSFDREQALERAMQVFWRQGYEATSVSDLTRAMHINPPSLYAAFGDKERLYLEALGRYQQRRIELMTKWFDEEPTAKAAVRRLLSEAARELSRAGAPRGSMLVFSAMQCSSEALQAKLAERRASVRAVLKARIDRGVAEGELARGADSDALVDFYSAVFQGMSLQARGGASPKRLTAIAELAMRAWPDKK